MTLKLEFTTEPRRKLRLVTFESRGSHRKRSSHKGLRLGRKNFEDVSSITKTNGISHVGNDTLKHNLRDKNGCDMLKHNLRD